MVTTKLRKVGGSVMLATPPALLETLGLSAGDMVGLEVRDGALVVRPARPRYSLDELLAEGSAGTLSDVDREWLDDAPVGREAI